MRRQKLLSKVQVVWKVEENRASSVCGVVRIACWRGVLAQG